MKRLVADALRAISPGAQLFKPPEDPQADKPEQDTRPPLARYRTFPQKPFSVSDLTAGAWCEAQYYYVLTRLRGRRIRTEAMKGGTRVHEKLEDEIYTTVRVEVKKKEDGFGLRLWNIIQGLRTLRDTGLTRELEVWGLVDGHVVNGILDGLSYNNPDPEFEDEIRSSQPGQPSGGGPPQQAQITSFFPSSNPSIPTSTPLPRNLVYITDVKTRAAKTLPKGVQVRSTKIQLFLYHRFLSEMASDKLDYIQVFGRYGLDPDESFSDLFMAQMGALHDEVFVDTSQTPASSAAALAAAGVSSSEPPSSDARNRESSPTPDLIRYGSLRALVALLRSEIQLTFPDGADSIGSIVAVEYRARATAEDEEGGQIIGENIFAMDDDALDRYLAQSMEWWNGQRQARGVPISEAFKCRSCDFVDDCQWRIDQDQEILRRARENKELRSVAKTAGKETW